MLRSVSKWIAGTFVSGGAAVAAAVSFVDPDFANLQVMRCVATDWVNSVTTAKSDVPRTDARLTVLVARLDGDEEGFGSRYISEKIAGNLDGVGVRVIPLCRTLGAQRGTEALADITTRAEVTGREWLRQHQADVLVWGKVQPNQESYRLHFLSPYIQTAFYPLQSDVVVGKDSADAVPLRAAILIQATELTSTAGVNAGSGLYIADQLARIIGDLEEQATGGLVDRDNDVSRSKRAIYVAALYTLGNQAGGTEYAERGLAFVESEIAAGVQEPAAAYYWRGRFRLQLGARVAGVEEKSAVYRASLADYDEAAAIWAREGRTLDWASAQNMRGHVLRGWGVAEKSDARIETAAVPAFEAALTKFTRAAMPMDWALVTYNLGIAWQTIGDLRKDAWSRNPGDETLRAGAIEAYAKAGQAFDQALEVRTRTLAPKLWASTAASRASLLVSWGALEQNRARVEEAIAAFESTLEVRTHEQLPLAWAGIQDGLGTAQLALARLSQADGAERSRRSEMAICAFKRALDERDTPLGGGLRTSDRFPQAYDETRRHLVEALEYRRSLVPDEDVKAQAYDNAVMVYSADRADRLAEDPVLLTDLCGGPSV